MIRVEKAALAGALKFLARAIERRQTIPILSCYLVKPGQGEFTVSATNMDQWVSLTIPADCDGGDPFTIRADRLGDFVAGAVSSISIETHGGVALCRSAKAKALIPFLPASDWPLVEDPPELKTQKVSRQLLRRMVDFCADAVSDAEDRYYLQGIYLDASSGETVAAATDGLCLAAFPMAGMTLGCPFPIPSEAIDLAASACTADELDFSVCETRVIFTWAGGRVATKLIDGTFPDWRRVLANSPVAGTVECSFSDVLSAVERVSRASRATEAGWLIDKGALRIRSRDNDGTADVEDEAAATADSTYRTGFKSEAVLRTIKSLRPFEKKGSPGVIKLSGEGQAVRFQASADQEWPLRIVSPFKARYMPGSDEAAA